MSLPRQSSENLPNTNTGVSALNNQIFANSPEEFMKVAQKFDASSFSESDIEQRWNDFFQDFRDTAQDIIETRSQYQNWDENRKTIAIDSFMKALKEIYVEIDIKDHINAIVEGVNTAAEEAKKSGGRVLLVIADNHGSDKLIAKSAQLYLEEQQIDYQVVDFSSLKNTSTQNDILLIIDDAAYSGEQKEDSTYAIKNHAIKFKKIIFSFGGISTIAQKNILKASENFLTSPNQRLEDVTELIYQQKLPSLIERVEATDNTDAKILLNSLFSPQNYIPEELIAGYTTYKIPDLTSVPAVLRPAHLLEKKFYPDAI